MLLSELSRVSFASVIEKRFVTILIAAAKETKFSLNEIKELGSARSYVHEFLSFFPIARCLNIFQNWCD